MLLSILDPEKPIQIPTENHEKTIGWIKYQNDEFDFSFKYPEGLLSNFTVNTTDLGTTTLKKLSSKNGQTDGNLDRNSYNVYFEAGAVRYDGGLKQFIKKTLPEANNLQQLSIVLGKTSGVRITNFDIKADAYFIYNLFEKNNIIYNFSIMSDDPILIGANKPLLEDILTTVKF